MTKLVKVDTEVTIAELNLETALQAPAEAITIVPSPGRLNICMTNEFVVLPHVPHFMELVESYVRPNEFWIITRCTFVYDDDATPEMLYATMDKARARASR